MDVMPCASCLGSAHCFKIYLHFHTTVQRYLSIETLKLYISKTIYPIFMTFIVLTQRAI